MNEQKAVQVHPDTRRAVLRMLEHGGDPRNIEQVVDAALKDWLAAAAVANPGIAAAASRGYQWKSLFLPEGTLLRICVGGQYTEAAVCGDHIVFQGRRCSPRQFVMQVTGQVRNAWLALWIRCPGDARWHLADTRRHILRRARPAAVAPSVPALDPSAAWRAHLRAARLRRDDCVRQPWKKTQWHSQKSRRRLSTARRSSSQVVAEPSAALKRLQYPPVSLPDWHCLPVHIQMQHRQPSLYAHRPK